VVRPDKRLARAGVGLRHAGGPALGRVGLRCLHHSSRVVPVCNLSREVVAPVPDYALVNDNPHVFLKDDSGNYLSFILDVGAETGFFDLTTPGAGLTYAPSSGPPPLTADQQSYTLTGVAAGLKADRKITAAQATFTQTGFGAGLDVTMPATQATYTLTGIAAGTRAGRRIVAAQSAFTATGYTTGMDVGMPATQASYTLTGYDAGLTYTPDAGNPPLTADQQTYTLTGVANGLRAGRRIVAAQATFTHAGIAAGTVAARKATAAAATYSLTGTATGLAVVRRVAAAQATFTWTGVAASFTKTGPVMAAVKTEFYLTGIDMRPVKQSGAVYVIT
jgi:hypothetical protein